MKPILLSLLCGLILVGHKVLFHAWDSTRHQELHNAEKVSVRLRSLLSRLPALKCHNERSNP
jgi:hypothetical protein